MRVLKRLSKALAAAAALAVAVTACAIPLARQPVSEPDPAASTSPLDLPNLERAFWICDYIGTTEGVSAAPIALCATVTHDLKHRKFGGDFDELVVWWRENKAAEFARLERGWRPATEQDASLPKT